MGCEQSTPVTDTSYGVNNNKNDLSKSAHAPPKPSNRGTYHYHPSEPLSRSAQSHTTAASTSPSLAGPAVSLEVDEEECYEIPKVDHNGNLLTEEIVRRTSTGLQTTFVTIGSTEKGGKELKMEVRTKMLLEVSAIYDFLLISFNFFCVLSTPIAANEATTLTIP